MKEQIAKRIAKIQRNYKGDMKLPCVFDRALRTKEVAEELIRYLEEDMSAGAIPADITVACSGKFGRIVETISPYPIIYVEGGLRWKESPVPVLTENLGECVFVDDGIYTCRTYSKTATAVEKAGGDVIAIYCGYRAGNPYRQVPIRSICTSEDVRRYLDDC
jgi:hypothetical protein